MRLSCPACGFTGDAEAWLAEPAWRDALVAALALPGPLADRLLRYLRLFSPHSRSLSPDRAARLLRQLLEPIAAGAIERNGRTWPAPLDYWQSALDELLERRSSLTLPLKTHGYLFEIVAGIAGKAEGRAEAKREEARRYPYSADRTSGNAQPAAAFVPPPAEFKALVQRLRRPGETDAADS